MKELSMEALFIMNNHSFVLTKDVKKMYNLVV